MRHSQPYTFGTLTGSSFDRAERCGAKKTAPKGCVVLQYCRVGVFAHDPLQLAVEPYRFEQQIAYLAENYHLMSVEELNNHLACEEPFPERSVLLTFDGGYAELLYVVADVLRQFGVCALAFVPSASFVAEGARWYDELEDLLIASTATGDLELLLDDESYRWSLQSQYGKLTAYNQLFTYLSQKPPQAQRRILDEIARCVCRDRSEADNHRGLAVEELLRLEEAGSICVGATTHHHVSLDALTDQERLFEIATNKEALEEVLGHSIRCFAQPYWSISNRSDIDVELLRDLGFDMIFYNSPGYASVEVQSRHCTFPRLHPDDRSLFHFHQQMVRLFTGLSS